jgi:tRNA G46 methylase TrmB
MDVGKSFSLYYNDLARWLFMTLIFTGILSTGWFGIPLAPKYLSLKQIDVIAGIFTVLSILAIIWGIMGYREFTRSAELIRAARHLARKLDPMVGDYQYCSYNPETREYDDGYVPLGPIDFWDKETQVPIWLDKGKYWQILLGLQSNNKEIVLQVVSDQHLPFTAVPQNVAVTFRESLARISSKQRKRKQYRYRVKIPQWLVMNTERSRFVNVKERFKINDMELGAQIAELNKKLVLASDEVVIRERPRIKYQLKFITTLGIYLNKSLPFRIIYRQIRRHLPRAKTRTIDYTNENLANIKDDELILSLIEFARQRGISGNRIDNLKSLIKFLKTAYTRQGLGDGSSEYHNFHHSLEVAYMSLQMLPKLFHGYIFTPKDYELLLVAALLHDYDPSQMYSESGMNEPLRPKGPKVVRTIDELHKSRLHNAYFSIDKAEFEDYLQAQKSALIRPSQFVTTHPEYIKAEDKVTIEGIIIEALIWHTDFPYFKQNLARETFTQLLNEISKAEGQDADKIKLMAEVLWIADLCVTYMGSDPIRAWDRVTNLYDELYLPKVEAVSRTDAFFSDFAETGLFKELIRTRQFPDIFRQRWNLVYHFFHEGNPSTQLNRTIHKARKLYLKVNMEIEMHNSEMLHEIAAANWAEYFIGISKDQNEVLQAKSKFYDLDPPNASSFWGDAQKLLPNIPSKSIDNFILILPTKFVTLTSKEEKLAFKSLFGILPDKLRSNGTLQLLTELERKSITFKELLEIIVESGLQLDLSREKGYFQKNMKNPDFIEVRDPYVLVFNSKK